MHVVRPQIEFRACSFGPFSEQEMIKKPVSAGTEQMRRGMVYVQCQCKGFQPMGNESSNFVYSIRPGSQSRAVAKSEELWRTTGQSNLAGKRLAATTATRTAAFWPMEQSFILSIFTFQLLRMIQAACVTKDWGRVNEGNGSSKNGLHFSLLHIFVTDCWFFATNTMSKVGGITEVCQLQMKRSQRSFCRPLFTISSRSPLWPRVKFVCV